MALALDSLKPIFPKYDYRHTVRAKEACSTYLSEKNPFNLPPASEMEGEQVPPYGGAGVGGETNTKAIDWKGKSRGLFFHHPQGNVNVICVKLSEECKSPVPVICRERTKTRCTQTRYRESSAQTRPYLPDVAGDKENYQHFEVYQISKLLDGRGPPGDYDVKVVERARRRRRYENALQTVSNDKAKQRTILEAMEWEDWVAREEDIQGCQMLRMEIVERIFKERQKTLQQLSEKRIANSTERIQSKRASQMKKINVEFARGMRRLEAKKQKITRCYRKGDIIQEHIDPASDLHAPQMRFGVNPNRRHFVGFRKTFDDRIDDLDKQRDERGLAALICPFSKLRSWAKPKQRMREVSQRFCSDGNLKNLYESLRGLRTVSEATKANPKCLKRKTNAAELREIHVPELVTEKAEQEAPKLDLKEKPDQPHDPQLPTSHDELTDNLRQRRASELSAKTDEEMSSILGEFEGTTLGRLLIFLNDELERLKLEKKFQAIQMLAERERWKREATEAGLRQKENKLRDDQEKLYQKACDIHRDTSSLFLQSVLEEEFNYTSASMAREKITELAKEIDTRDLDSIRLHGVEGRAYDRMAIRDYVKNQVFAVAEKRFAKMKADKLHEAQLRAIEEELFAGVEKALAAEYTTLDSVSIVGELLDELIADAVTYDFDILTPSSSGNDLDTEREVNEIINKLLTLVTPKPDDSFVFTDSTQFETHLTAEKEARAVIRKMIRRAVPEQRWKEDSERVVEQTLSETFNDAIYEVECLKASRYVLNNEKLNNIISDIYSRMEGYKKKDHHVPNESSDSTLSACLRSIRSTIDIFDKFADSDSDEDSHGNITLIEEVPQERSIRKIDYIDRSQLKKQEPVDIGRRHERYNIMGKVAKRYQSEEYGGVNLQIFGEDSDISNSSTTSNSGLVSYTSQYVELAKSRVFSTPWIRNIHPELSGYEGQGSSDLRMSSSYERGSVGFERLSGSYRRSEANERRASH